MHGHALRGLLKTLREAGVTRYATPELTIELGPAPKILPPMRMELGEAPDVEADPEIDDRAAAEAETGVTDWRFALERLGPANFGKNRGARTAHSKRGA